jgi:hypothetical protein
MPHKVLQITAGPDKPDLQWSLTQPGEETMVHFRLNNDAVDTQIEEMDEQPDGLSFRLRGRLSSGLEGFYSVETRSGLLELSH